MLFILLMAALVLIATAEHTWHWMAAALLLLAAAIHVVGWLPLPQLTN